MRELFHVKLNDSLRKHINLHKEAEPEVEINLSDEAELLLALIEAGVYEPEKHYLYLSPYFTRKIAETIANNNFYSISLITDSEGHKLRGKASDVRKLLELLKGEV